MATTFRTAGTRQIALAGLGLAASGLVGATGTAGVAACGALAGAAATTWFLIRRPAAALALVLLLLALATPVIALPFNPAKVLFVPVLAALAWTAILFGGRRIPRSVVLSALLVLLPVFSEFVVHTTVRRMIQVEAGMLTIIGVAALTAMLARRHPAQLEAALRWMLWFSIAMGLLAVYQRLSGIWPYIDTHAAVSNGVARGTSAAYPNRAAATFGHPIIYGGFCQAMVLVAVTLRPKLWWLFAATNIVGVVLTGTRAAWIATAILLLVVYLLQRRAQARQRVGVRRRLPVEVLVAVPLAFIGFAFSAPATFSSATSTIGQRVFGQTAAIGKDARQTRNSIGWNEVVYGEQTKGSTVQLDKVLFGYGNTSAQSFWANGPELHDGGARTFDNTYVTVFYEYGVVGIAVIAALALVGLFTGSMLGRLILAGVLFDLAFYDAAGWPVALALVGLALGLRALSPAEPVPSPA